MWPFTRLSSSHTPKARDFICWDWRSFAAGGSSEPTLALLDSLHTPVTQSDQISLAVWPQVSLSRVSDISFYKAIYSWCSNMEKSQAGVSEEETAVKYPPGFYPLIVQAQKTLALPFWVFSPLQCLPVPIHLLLCPFIWKGLADHSFLLQAPASQNSTCSTHCSCTQGCLHQKYSSTATCKRDNPGEKTNYHVIYCF